MAHSLSADNLDALANVLVRRLLYSNGIESTASLLLLTPSQMGVNPGEIGSSEEKMGVRSLHTLMLVCLWAIASATYAAPPDGNKSKKSEAGHPVVRYPANSSKIKNLRNVPILPDKVYDVRKLERKTLPNRLDSVDLPEDDLVLQPPLDGPSALSADISFDGVNNRNGVLPPDTVGAIGVSHYVQMTNLSFAIYNRDGTIAYGPANNNTLWGALGGPCATENDGDPIVLYDKVAHRWLMSQFALPNFPNGPFYQCIAISQTEDPTGGWHLYSYLVSNTKLNDYPKFGSWPDGYYMSINQFSCNAFSCNWGGQGAIVFERDKMLVGDPTARMVYFDLYSINPNLGGMLPSDLDSATPPPVGSPNYFVLVDDNSWGYSPDQLQIWKFHVDWSNPASNSTFTFDKTLATAAFDSNLCGYSRNCISQPGTPVRVDALSDRLMFRLQYRNFGDGQALVTNHSVDVGSDHAGVRWYELRNSGSGWNIYQQGTFAPDSDHRWMGSVAMNGAGDMALGYSVSSTSTYPSVRFTGRLNGDPLGLMTQGEGTIVTGSGYQTHSSGRWGDYSAMSVDPIDDCTFWYTQEYYLTAGASPWKTRIGSFKLSNCGPADSPPTVTLTEPTDGATISGSVNVVATATDDNGVNQVEFFVDGTSIGTDSNAGDGWSQPWNTALYVEGIHTVRAVATDTIGQTGSDSHPVIVDNIPDPPAHITDLDGQSVSVVSGSWDAVVTIVVKDSSGAFAAWRNATGTWGDGGVGSSNCTTNPQGNCQVRLSGIPTGTTSVSFTVTSISGAYDPGANTDPDGDSDGTRIVVCLNGCTPTPPPWSGSP